MTATPPRPDLRTLATHAAHDVDCPDGPNCREDLTTDGRYGRYADAVLAAALPEYRRMVLGEAAEAIEEDGFGGECSAVYERLATMLRRLAAAAPPVGLSATVPAGTAPAVPEEADGQRTAEGDALHAPDDVYRLIAADRAARWDYVHTLPPEDLAAYIRTQSLDPNLREDADTAWWAARSRYGKQRDRALAAHEEEFERANRLAAQVAQCQRVVEAVRALHQPTVGEADTQWCSVCSQDEEQPQPTGWWVPWPCPTIAAVDALSDAGPHQHECACNRNWGGPCGPCVCEEPPRQGVWRLVCGAGNIPPNQTYATKGAAEDVMRLHDGACSGAHAVEFVPDAGTDQTEDEQ